MLKTFNMKYVFLVNTFNKVKLVIYPFKTIKCYFLLIAYQYRLRFVNVPVIPIPALKKIELNQVQTFKPLIWKIFKYINCNIAYHFARTIHDIHLSHIFCFKFVPCLYWLFVKSLFYVFLFLSYCRLKKLLS